MIGVAGVLAATTPVERIHDRIGAEERLAADAFLADTARGLHAEGDASDDPADDVVGSDVAGRGRSGPGVMPEDLGRIAQQIAVVLDPDGPELDDQYALQRRGVTIGRLHQGLHRITGHLFPDAAAQLQAVLDAMLNPKVDGPPHPTGVRFTPSPVEDGRDARSDADESLANDTVSSESDAWNADPRAVIDPRTHAQKRHD
ncbi:13E12 repeat family protein, partial [Microbacterium sp. SZ1]|uniref:13E12 repeat family protein n=1 Tax=Microbacterium sp. SZ1 TaxID=1849736 RepID=UPI00211CBD66